MLLAALVALHGPENQTIYVNPDTVTNIRKPRGIEQGHFAKQTNCIVYQTDGKFFLTRESCEDVLRLLQGR